MKVELLNSTSAYTEGSSLWVLPNKECSSWCRNLDRYLDFQIATTLFHQPTQPSSTLQTIADENEIKIPECPKTDGQPILITSDKRLPNSHTLIITFRESFQAWLNDIAAVWSDLKRPSLRVFLPEGVSPEEFEAQWNIRYGDTTITLVANS
jgi:hypothetical protein